MSHRAIIRTVLLILPAIFCMYSVVLADGKAEPSGAWRWERKLQERTLKSTLKLKLVDGKLMGTYHGLGDEVAIESAKLDGDTLSFEVNREFNDQKFTIRFQGKIKGDKIPATSRSGIANSSGRLVGPYLLPTCLAPGSSRSKHQTDKRLRLV